MNIAMFSVSLAIFTVTIVLVVKRPRRIDIGYSALAGALVSVILGITTLSDVLIVWNIVWNATFTLVAIIISSMIFDEAGFFEYVALKVARRSRNSGMALFMMLVLLASGVSAFFSNDGTVLVMTPIVYAILTRMGMEKKLAIPFIMGIGIIADTASMPLVVSNLTNIITASYFRIGFLTFSSVMVIPDIVSIASTVLILAAFYRRQISQYRVPKEIPEDIVIRDPVIFRLALPFIAAMIILYSVGGVYRVPVAFISVPAVALLSFYAALRKRIDIRNVIRKAPWQIVVFSLGMYIIVFGLGRSGLTEILTEVIEKISVLPGPLPVVTSGVLFSGMAAVMNNLPSVMIGNLALHGMPHSQALIYANVIGNNIGPKFTPIGSLATLLWLHTLERKGYMKIETLYYMRVGFTVALPVLLATLLALWLVML